jgi:putative transposase
MHVHLVFVTKYRRDVLSELAIGDLTQIFAKVCGHFGAGLKECSGEYNHVHLLVIYPPKVAVSKLAQGRSPAGCCASAGQKITRTGVLRSPSYFAGSCGGAPLALIAKPQPKRGRASSPPRRTGFPARRLR